VTLLSRGDAAKGRPGLPLADASGAACGVSSKAGIPIASGWPPVLAWMFGVLLGSSTVAAGAALDAQHPLFALAFAVVAAWCAVGGWRACFERPDAGER
jgi:hypothetical protein